MANKYTVTLENKAEVMAALAELGEAASDVLLEAVRAGGQVIQQEAGSRVPGYNDESIILIEKEVSPDAVSVEIGPDRDHFYLTFVEYGTEAHLIEPDQAQALLIDGQFAAGANHPGSNAQPFLRPSFEDKVAEAEAAVAEELKRALGL